MALSRRPYLIGLDIGGTKILAVLFDRKFKIIGEKKLRVEPHLGKNGFFKTLQEAVDGLLDEAKVKLKTVAAVGAGCPGIISNPEGRVELSPNLAFLKGCRLRKEFTGFWGVPAVVDNDVNFGLYGEQQFGAARGAQHVAGVFLGTGVGGAFIFNGKIYSGFTGAAGEIGHTYLRPPFEAAGQVQAEASTVEGMLGRLAISAEASLLLMRQQAPALFESAGYDVKRIKSKALVRAIQQGDTALQELIESKARVLGVVMANLVNLLSPQLIVLGGGVIEALGAYMIPEARRIMKELAMPPLVKAVRVVPAALKDYAIAMGAAKAALDHIGG